MARRTAARAGPRDHTRGSVHPFHYDLADIHGLSDLMARVEARVGPVDVLVNCAGFNREIPVLELTPEAWRAILAVDLEAPVMLAVAAARGMAARGYGRIVNITSVHGVYGAERSIPSAHGACGAG